MLLYFINNKSVTIAYKISYFARLYNFLKRSSEVLVASQRFSSFSCTFYPIVRVLSYVFPYHELKWECVQKIGSPALSKEVITATKNNKMWPDISHVGVKGVILKNILSTELQVFSSSKEKVLFTTLSRWPSWDSLLQRKTIETYY